MFKSQVTIATAILSVVMFTTSANAGQKDLEGALTKLVNIVNNSIPEKYRAQLNPALAEVILAAENQCVASGSGGNSRKSNCEISKNSFGSFIVLQGGTVMSQYSHGSILDAKSDFDALVNAGVCSQGSISADCTIDKNSFGSFVVSRNGEVASQYSHGSAVDAAADRTEMKRVGICN